MLRRVVGVVVVVLCVAGVITYQATRPERTPASGRVFVPSPKFFLDFSPSFRTTIADAYYLQMVQYYGEHLKRGELESMPPMADLVTSLSPHFQRAYVFAAFALTDAGRPDLSVKLLQRGFEQNPDQWMFPALIGYFAYQYGPGTKAENDLEGARWYQKAAAVPGSPSYLLRLAAVLSGKGGDMEKAVTMWGQVYAVGDKFTRQRAVTELEQILPADKTARMKAVAPLVDTMPKAEFDQLVAELFKGYE